MNNITRRQFGKNFLAAAAMLAVPATLAKALVTVASKLPAKTLLKADVLDVIYFCVEVSKRAEQLLNELSPARRVLVVDPLEQSAGPKYSTTMWRDSFPQAISSMWNENSQRFIAAPHFDADKGETIGELFQESHLLIDGKNGIDPKLWKDEWFINHHARTCARNFARREGRHLVTLLDAITGACDRNVYQNAYAHDPTGKKLIDDTFGLVENEDRIIHEIVCNQHGLAFLQQSVPEYLDVIKSKANIWKWQSPNKNAVQVAIGEETQQTMLYTAVIVLVDDPRLDNCMYMCAHGDDIGVIAIRQDVCVIHGDGPNRRHPMVVSFYEPAYVAQPGYVSCLNFRSPNNTVSIESLHGYWLSGAT